MKQIGIRVLALILAGIMSFSALSCAKKETPSADTGNSAPAKTDAAADPDGPADLDGPSNPDAPSSPDTPAEEAAETEWPVPDYSDFIMPEETGELTVYTTDMLSVTLTPAVEIFKTQYPGVDVTVKMLGDDEYEALVRTELPAGRGPDLLFSFGIDLPDIFKSITAGIFEDLNPYFMNDPEFLPEEYVEGVLDGGLYRGRRYFLPVEYICPVIGTTAETLEDAGLRPEDFSLWENFIDALIRYKERVPEGDMLLVPLGHQNAVELYDLFEYAGFEAIDYAKGTASLDEAKMKRIADAAKAYYREERAFYMDNVLGVALVERKGLFVGELNATYSVYGLMRGLRAQNETPLIFAMPDCHDGVTARICSLAALPQGAKNKLNAYRLLKILLSEELQGGQNATGLSNLRIGLPVNKNALRGMVYGTNQKYPDVDGTVITEEDAAMLFGLVSSPTRAEIIPPTVKRYLQLEIFPYVRGEKGWDDCWKRFVSTLELYASE